MKNFGMLFGLFLIACGSVPTETAQAASAYPDRPITLVVAASAGGGGDTFARTLAANIQKHKLLPQPLVVENKVGGGGSIAFAYVASKKKDPYYLLVATPPLISTPIIGLTPIGLKDFTPVANLAFDQYVLMASLNSNFKSLNEVVVFAKANPRKVSIGVAQLGGASSMCIHLLEKAAGIQLNYVVFPGSSQINVALLGGHIDLAVATPGPSFELYKTGKISMLGVFAEKRLTDAPEIATINESGFNVALTSFRGIAAPLDIPPDARAALEQALLKHTQTETFQSSLKNEMLTPAWMDGETFTRWLEREYARYAVVLKEMNLIQKK